MPADPPGHTIPIPLLADDVGPAGHINNVASMRVIDTARQMFLGTRLTAPAGLLGQIAAEVGHVVRAQTVEYPAEYWRTPEPVLVRMWITGVGRSSFRLASSITTPDGDRPAVVAEATYVLVERTGGAPWPITDELRRELERYAGDPSPIRPRPH